MDPWGIKDTTAELRDVVLPDGMKRAMAGQAESERERRDKIINAEGGFQAAEKLGQAATMIHTQPIALQWRFLQTMREIPSEPNPTTFLPVRIPVLTLSPSSTRRLADRNSVVSMISNERLAPDFTLYR